MSADGMLNISENYRDKFINDINAAYKKICESSNECRTRDVLGQFELRYLSIDDDDTRKNIAQIYKEEWMSIIS